MARRVLLTGATGFVGREVGRELHRAGHALSSLVRGSDPALRLAQLHVPGRPVPGELEDLESLRAAVRGSDVVVHAAAVVDPRLQRDRANVQRVNRELAIELGRVAREEGVRTFVFVSSIAAVGFWSGTATATSPCVPETGYGRAKLEAERALLAMAGPDYRVVVLRPPTVYGPGEPYNFLDWVRSVNRGLFRIIGTGENCFPLATTANVARAILAAVDDELPTGAGFVADAEPYTMNRIHDAILRALGKRRRFLHLPVRLATAAGAANEALHAVAPRAPLVLTRARVRTLTVDQRLDVTPLLAAGVPLDAPLERWVDLTVRDYRARALLPDV